MKKTSLIRRLQLAWDAFRNGENYTIFSYTLDGKSTTQWLDQEEENHGGLKDVVTGMTIHSISADCEEGEFVLRVNGVRYVPEDEQQNVSYSKKQL